MAHALEQSAGNALFLEEIIRAIAEGQPEEGSETVVAMLQARIGRLTAGPRRAIRAASVFGQTLWHGGVASLLGQSASEMETKSWLAALVDAELLQCHAESRFKNDREYRFRHALVRDAAYSLLTDSDLITGHRLAGEWLEQSGEQEPQLLAEHFDRAGEGARAAAYYLQAAENALDGGDFLAVHRLVERGLLLGQVPELRAALRAVEGDAHFRSGDLQRAIHAAGEALELARPGSRTEGRSLFSLILCVTHLRNVDMFDSAVERLLHTEPEPDALVLVASAFFSVIMRFLFTAQRGPATVYLQRIEDVVARSRDQAPLAMAWVELARAFYAGHIERDPWGFLNHVRQCGSYFQLADPGGSIPYGRFFIGAGYWLLGLFDQAERELERTLGSLPPNSPEVLSIQQERFGILLDRRKLDEAAILGAEVIRLAEAQDNLLFVRITRLLMVEVHLYQGATEAAESAALALSHMEAEPYLGLWYLTVMAYIRLVQRRWVEASEFAERAYVRTRACGMGYCDRHAMLLLVRAEAFHALGNHDAARDAIREAEGDLLRRAGKIPDLAVRRCFVENIPDHRRTLVRAREWLGNTASCL